MLTMTTTQIKDPMNQSELTLCMLFFLEKSEFCNLHFALAFYFAEINSITNVWIDDIFFLKFIHTSSFHYLQLLLSVNLARELVTY